MSNMFSSAAIAVFAMASAANAGGYDVGERDWDFLFQEKTFATEATVRYVAPQRVLDAVNSGGLGTTAHTDETSPFTIFRGSVAARFGEHFSCLASYRKPWAGHAAYDTGWSSAAAAIEQHFDSNDYGLTCGAATALGMGQFHLLGGISYQEISYELIQLDLANGGTTNNTTNVEDSGIAWRAGLAYTIPQYALRASLIYNSAVDYDMEGTLAIPFSSTTLPIYGDITMPQSVELKLQSGIAPGWLAYGSVRWTDWSVLESMPLCTVGTSPCTIGAAVSGLELQFKDSWTVTLGAARVINEWATMVGSATWDQGASQGFTSQTDTWAFGLNTVLTPNENVLINLGGTLGVLTSGSVSTATLADGSANPVGYIASFGNDLVYSLSANAVLKF